MNKQLEALDRVCEKRIARQLEQGKSITEAYAKVVEYLDEWLSRHGKYEGVKREFGIALRAAYSS